MGSPSSGSPSSVSPNFTGYLQTPRDISPPRRNMNGRYRSVPADSMPVALTFPRFEGVRDPSKYGWVPEASSVSPGRNPSEGIPDRRAQTWQDFSLAKFVGAKRHHVRMGEAREEAEFKASPPALPHRVADSRWWCTHEPLPLPQAKHTFTALPGTNWSALAPMPDPLATSMRRPGNLTPARDTSPLRGPTHGPSTWMAPGVGGATARNQGMSNWKP